MYVVEAVTLNNQGPFLDFLKRFEEYSLFLIGNFENNGPRLTHAPNSGNFKIIKKGNEIVAAFCLARRGSLLITSSLNDPAFFPLIWGSVKIEPITFKGILGDWNFCEPFWKYIKDEKIITKETYTVKETLYAWDVSESDGDKNVRMLVPSDFLNWMDLRRKYIEEEGLPNTLTDTQMHEDFIWKSQQGTVWGYFVENQLVSTADFNAKGMDLAQLGGVFTLKEHRKKGYSKAVMKQILSDAKSYHKLRKIVIFTGEENFAARKLYESLKVKQVGNYALLFGKP